jgi:hypothetical protein
MTKKAENLNQAIVNKLDSILKNTDCVDGIYITIEGNRGEVPTITYKIRELIIPEEDKGKY